MEDFFDWLILASNFLDFLLWLLLFLDWHIIRQSLDFPGRVKNVLQQFALDERNLLLGLPQEVEFVGLLIGSLNLLENNGFDLFVAQFQSHTTVFLQLLDLGSSLQFSGLDIVDGVVKLVGIGDVSATHEGRQGLSKSLDGYGQFGCDGIQHISNLFISLLKSRVLDDLQEGLAGGWLRFEEVVEQSLLEVELGSDGLNGFSLTLHCDKRNILKSKKC
jgi:hypothetical protein